MVPPEFGEFMDELIEDKERREREERMRLELDAYNRLWYAEHYTETAS